VRRLLILPVLLFACSDETPEPAPPPPPPPPDVDEVLARHHVEWDAGERERALSEGADAIARHECTRCHDIDELPPGGRSDHCVSCHQWLGGLEPGHRHYTMLSERYGEETLLRYQRNIYHYRQVPNLTGIAKRLHPEWIDTFLQSPWDLRPALDETMVRTNLSEADRRRIVRYFAAVAEVADPYEDPHPVERGERPSEERIAAGRELFLGRGCTQCHTFGNLDTGKTAEDLENTGFPARLAPNLRFARDRMDRDIMIAWIQEPEALLEGTLMADMQLSAEEAAKVADFLLWAEAPVDETPPVPSLEPPAPVERPVGWAEVKEKVLGRICVHCHMNDHERDRGPGNEGGYGWPGSQLAMRTYETLVYGAVGEDGERYSVLEPQEEGGVAPIVEVMMLRRVEERRDRVAAFEDHERPAHVHERLGMPMGLPHIPDDEVALVRGWIAQGCPGPTAVTGMPGITDGFLVPDGPIEVNEGCQLRAPSEERPAWSTRPPPEWERPDMSSGSARSGSSGGSGSMTSSGMSAMSTMGSATSE